MFFNYFKKKKNKKNKGKKSKFTENSYKKNSISKVQMMEITNAVLSKKRLFVYSESI
jgi:hypothetical protein